MFDSKQHYSMSHAMSIYHSFQHGGFFLFCKMMMIVTGVGWSGVGTGE